MPFADASFDAVASTQVYEYVEDMPAAGRRTSSIPISRAG
jgi:hypothetical protein